MLSVVSFRLAELRFVSYCPVVMAGLPDCAQMGQTAAVNATAKYLSVDRATELEELMRIMDQLLKSGADQLPVLHTL